jgi:hypothetical protein
VKSITQTTYTPLAATADCLYAPSNPVLSICTETLLRDNLRRRKRTISAAARDLRFKVIKCQNLVLPKVVATLLYRTP